MTLDAKFRWKPHVKKKREELGLRYKKIYWLTERVSSLSLHNKHLLYKQILKPYGYTVSNSGIAANKVTETLYNDSRTKFYGTLSMHPGTVETLTSTDTWKWTLCLAKSRVAQKHEENLHHHEKV